MCPIKRIAAGLSRLAAAIGYKGRSTSFKEKSFRCPFEVGGLKDGTIINVTLGKNREERLQAMTQGFADFHAKPESPGLRFLLPAHLLETCRTNSELILPVLTYQTEVLAAELEYRLAPLLPYQMHRIGRDAALEIFKADPFRGMIVSILIKTMHECGFAPPTCAHDLAVWLGEVMMMGMKTGVRNPSIKMFDFDASGERVNLASISPGQVTLHTDQVDGLTAIRNKNCFGIVKTPFYPQTFGRFSPNVEIIMSRERDFISVPPAVRQKIRLASNTVLARHGIEITDFLNDKPEGEGLWVPDYKKA